MDDHELDGVNKRLAWGWIQKMDKECTDVNEYFIRKYDPSDWQPLAFSNVVPAEILELHERYTKKWGEEIADEILKASVQQQEK